MRGCLERQRADFEVLAKASNYPILEGRSSRDVRPGRGFSLAQGLQTRVDQTTSDRCAVA
jgi:hypothetical protein